MSIGPEVDEEEYRFADRYVAARAWAIAAALVERLPGMRVSQVVDETRTPLLIVHDATERQRVQLDMVAWVQFCGADGQVQHLYWDEVFASRLEDVVDRIVAAVGPVEDDGVPGRLAVYRYIADLLAVGLADEAGWWVQQVRVGGRWDGTTAEVLQEFDAGEDVATAALESAVAGVGEGEPVVFHEPLWVLRRGLEAIALLDASTGLAHLPGGFPHAAGRLVQVGEAETVPFDEGFQHLFATQWAYLDPERPADPSAELALPRYGHIRAEAWRIVAAVAERADVRVAGPAARGEICRVLDADGCVKLRLTNQGIHVEGTSEVRDWWDVLAAPLPTSVPDALLDALPPRDPEAGDASGTRRVLRYIAGVMAAAVDDDEDWRVMAISEHSWAVVRGTEWVAALDERGTDSIKDPVWTARADAGEVLREISGVSVLGRRSAGRE